MVNTMQLAPDSEEEIAHPQNLATDQQLMVLSAAAVHLGSSAPRTMKLQVGIQGHEFLFLVDSGSSACFIDAVKAELLTGSSPLSVPVSVKVAGGAVLQSTHYFPQLGWSASDAELCDSFRILALGGYDGIIGLDWLVKYSPMLTHWDQGWIAIPHGGRQVVLHEEGSAQCTHALIELHLVSDAEPLPAVVMPPEVRAILDKFASVFSAPVGLPLRRRYDHHIPLILGARPVSVRPYRVAPELKTEIERQVQEMLDQGVITHSSSAFGSPVLLVKKEDLAWCLVVDYRLLSQLRENTPCR